jgi:hypothetical protein
MTAGHIQKRGRNWRLKFDVPSADGTRASRYCTFHETKREAEIKLAQLIAENARGTYIES